MDILDLLEELGLEPRKTASSKGGEYHCPCPKCGGKDRFICWPQEGRYWCRQCKAKGDAIQFCRDFLGLSFRDACLKMQNNLLKTEVKPKAHNIPPSALLLPSHFWKKKAASFAEQAHQRLLIDQLAVKQIFQRGLSVDTIKKYMLGWNPVTIFNRRSEWGLEETRGREWICLPSGIVIPLSEGPGINKLKIRKFDWKEGDLYGKYYEIPGSSNALPLLGSSALEVTVIVEAEFDAMLIIQEAGDLCNCIALGGVSKRPHPALHEWLLRQKALLYALDFDEAGKKEYIDWQKKYPKLEPWPVPEEKSPGDYLAAKGDIREWIKGGLKNLPC